MFKKYHNVHLTTPYQLEEYNKIIDDYSKDKNYIIPKNFPIIKIFWKKIPLFYFSVGNIKIIDNNLNFKPYSLRYILALNPVCYLNFEYKFSYEFSNIKSIEKYKYENNKMKLNINMIKLIISNNNKYDELLLWIENNFIVYNYSTEKLYNNLKNYYKEFS